MIPKVPFIPKVTTSRKELLEHIKKVSEWYNTNTIRTKEWIDRVQEDMVDAYYFEGIIFVKYVSPYLIFHELIHHISRILKYLTNSKVWYNILDETIDDLDILIFRK